MMLIKINGIAQASDYEKIHHAIENGMQPVPTHLWTLTKEYVFSRPEAFIDNGKKQNLVDVFYYWRGEAIIHALNQYVLDFISFFINF